MLTAKHKCPSNFFLLFAITIGLGGHAVDSQALEVVQNTSCVDQLNADVLGEIKGQYIDAKTNTFPIQILSIDLNNDQYCDLLVEFQGDYLECEADSIEPCNVTKPGRWTNFYLATTHNEYSEEAISATRDRWSSGGKYISYKVEGETTPFVVWDLRSMGRVEEYSDSYTVFQVNESFNYLDATIRYHDSIDQEKAQAILEFHNEQFSR